MGTNDFVNKNTVRDASTLYGLFLMDSSLV